MGARSLRSIRVAVFLAAVAAVVSGLAACGGSSSEGESREPPLATLASKTPKGIAEQAGLDGVRSGQLEANLVINDQSGRELFAMRLPGWCEGLGGGALPQLHIAASSKGGIDARPVDPAGKPH